MCVCVGGGGGGCILGQPLKIYLVAWLLRMKMVTVVSGGPQTKLADHLPSHANKLTIIIIFMQNTAYAWVLQRD